jgi:hypothetical protein
MRSRLLRSAVCALVMGAVLLDACARQSEVARLTSVPRPVFRSPPPEGHVPPIADVAADRDELIAVLDSLHSHYDRAARGSSRTARAVVIGALVAAAIGAASPAITDGDKAERKISQAAAAITGILAGISAELQLSKKSEAERLCTATLYHAVSDVRLRYSSLTLPTTDSAWTRYVAFKDSVDRAVRNDCP